MRMVRLGLTLCLMLHATASWSAQVIVNGPAGSGAFGTKVFALPNRNFVVTDPSYSIPGGAQNVGAAHLYSEDGRLISSLTGSATNDTVGQDVVVLPVNGNFLVLSFSWSALKGAVTWCSAQTGCQGQVSAANSLVGTATDNLVGSPNQVVALTNGNYVVGTIGYDDGATQNVGALAWGSGTSGVRGEIGIANALIGSSTNDRVGENVLALSNGNYVLKTIFWDDVTNNIVDAGAVTFVNGATGATGVVSVANSFTTGQSNPSSNPINLVALGNGNYLIGMPRWNGTRGAVTLADGTSVTTGSPNASRSLVGIAPGDAVGGLDRITVLANDNYVVRSPNWNQNRGAVTFGSGTLGVVGPISAANSLVGTATTHQVGSRVVPLVNGNYVVASGGWDNGTTTNAGAITFGSGTGGVIGEVSATNSLVGVTESDTLGQEDRSVTPLSGGGYVVSCQNCDIDGVVNSGAVVVAPSSGISGALSGANSLRGGIGALGTSNRFSVTALSDGNAAFVNATWRTATANTVGAVTWLPATGITGVVDASNSFLGTTASDQVGGGGVIAVANGNYVISSPSWDNGAVRNVGAVTLAQGGAPWLGTVSAANSLVGSTQDDFIGNRLHVLPNGNYVVLSNNWDNGTANRAGAITWGSGTMGVTGPITAANSWVGTRADDQLGLGTFRVFADSYWAASAEFWDAPGSGSNPVFNAGAVTLGLPLGPQVGQAGVFDPADLRGVLSTRNSAIGSVAGVASPVNIAYDYLPSDTPQARTLIVGMPRQNRVVLQSYDGFFRDGFE
jgi:hypothetical protein